MRNPQRTSSRPYTINWRHSKKLKKKNTGKGNLRGKKNESNIIVFLVYNLFLSTWFKIQVNKAIILNLC